MRWRAFALVVGVVASTLIGGACGDEKEGGIDAYLRGEHDPEFVSAEGHFKATFPTTPEKATENVPAGDITIPITFFTSEIGETAAFNVGVFELGAGATFDLNGAVNGAAGGVNGKVESSTAVKVQDHDAMEFVISAKEGLFVKGVVIKTPERAYQVQVVGDENPPKGYDKFKASFSIIP